MHKERLILIILIIFTFSLLICDGNISADEISEGKMYIHLSTFEEFPGDFVIIDSEGRKKGYDPIKDEEYDEIANAYYEEHEIVDSVTRVVDSRYKVLYLSEVNEERYHLQVIGIAKGSYILDFGFLDSENNDFRATFKKTISPGEIHTYTWKYEVPFGEEVKPIFCNEDGESDSESYSGKDGKK